MTPQNLDRDRLDEAIDLVTTRMTHVDEDAALVSRIIEALPERPAWSLQWLMPRLAITAVLGLAAALVVLRSFDDRSTSVLQTENAPAPVSAPAPVVERTAVEPPLIVRRRIVESASSAPRTAADLDRPDHDYSLPAIAEVAALNVDALMPASLPEDEPLTVAPLTIADLPLGGESFPR
jgi:hypothetical protein